MKAPFSHTLWVLLPAFNEEKSLDPLLPAIRKTMEENKLSYRILIVDDGSSDQTGSMLKGYEKDYPLTIITHKINRGLGETIRDLFETAAERAHPQDILVRMDCDITHDPKYIPDLVAKINEGFDVVTASRFLPGGGQSGLKGFRAFLSRGATLYMRTLFPIKGLREYTCGYRAYRAQAIQHMIQELGNRFIQLKELGFSCTLEKMVKLKLLGARIGEVPFVLYYDKKQSESKMVSSVTTFGYFVMALLYHWPFKGWKRSFKSKKKLH
jgi:dolichol-phosphate mannosyltransferase